MIGQTTTHASLLARLSGGTDAGAWSEFFHRYAELIRNFARRQNVQPADCDDILQDVLVSLTKAMPGFTYDPLRGKFRSYLKTVVIHAIYRKSCQKHGGVSLENLETMTAAADADQTIEAGWEIEWRQYHLRQAMQVIGQEFNDADQEAFERYAVAGQDAAAVARDLKLSVDQVYQAKSRILRRLSELIEQQVADEG